jgi:hypothetical protein
LTVALGLSGCGSDPLPDAELLVRFRVHRGEIKPVVGLLQEDRACDLVTWDRQVDCRSATVAAARRLLQRVGAEGIRRMNDEIVIEFRWGRSGTKGFAFREEEPPRLGKADYRRFEERWYIRALYE